MGKPAKKKSRTEDEAKARAILYVGLIGYK
jgi:hypothetical protein